MKYYLGIDGGGTRTTAAVSDENGKIIIKKQGKTINFYSVGMETARNNLDSLINEISTELGCEEFEGVFVGCSALDDKADEATLKALCGNIRTKAIEMNSDLYIALKSMGDIECPCVAVCGTGSMAIGTDKFGNTVVSGGWGHIIGDEGSGYAIAVNALKVCCELCDKGEASPLLDAAESYFGVSDFRKAIDIIYSPETTKDKLAGFAADIGKLAQADNTAKDIIISEAKSFARTVLILLDKIGCCSALGLYGGIFINNALFTEAFKTDIKSVYPDIDIKLLTVPPEESALELARNL
ncbi:MAG: hypothetical protein IKK37_07780 [Clostridia bacterium]|nr:hypothetical protein [Clostridia bacterium]